MLTKASRLMQILRFFLPALLVLLANAANCAECIAPAMPKGSFERTCELLRLGLQHIHATREPIDLTYIPGGVGAVAFNIVSGPRSSEPNTLVAFSGGTILNLAQGKFGKHTNRDVRWLAAVGLDYGVLAVRSESPYRTLNDLIDALSRHPERVVFGGSGTVGGQDWVKAALTARAAKTDRKLLRFVGFDSGGEANAALLSGHIDVVAGDVSDVIGLVPGKAPLRILAVLADKRLPGLLQNIPTARENGYDIEWTTIRGVYMGPHVSEAAYQQWLALISRMLADPEFIRIREEYGLYPFALTDSSLRLYIRELVLDYQAVARNLGLTVP